MFNCSKCEALKEALEFERSRTSDLLKQMEAMQKRLMAFMKPEVAGLIQEPRAVNPNDYYGTSEHDEHEFVDENGEKLILTQKQIDEILNTTN